MRNRAAPPRPLAPLPGRRPRGMTLVEVLVAGAIMVFGMLGIVALLNAGARSHKRAVDETIGVEAGRSVLAELRARFDFGVLPVATDPKNLPEHPDYPGYKYSVELKPLSKPATRTDSKGAEYFVEVRILWGAEGEEQSVAFQTIMFLRTDQ